MGFGGADGFHAGSGGGGGGTLTGANNGLSLSGTTVQLGGALIQPTVITSTGVNTLIVNNDFGSVGFGVNGVSLYVSGNQRLEPVANVTEDITGATVNTTDATVTPLQTIAIPIDTVMMIESYVTCRKTAGAGVGTIGDGNGYIRTVMVKNVAGIVTIVILTQSSFTVEDIPLFNTTFSVSGTNVILNVTGSLNNDVTWNSITKKYKV